MFYFDFNYELSYILVYLSIILYYKYPQYRSNILYHMICIAIIGNIEIYKRGSANSPIMQIIGVITHSILFIAFNDIIKTNGINNISILLLLLANFIIYNLPYWPYLTSRDNIMILYNSIFITLGLLFNK